MIGSVGSGKSSFLNTIIGDLLHVTPEILNKFGGNMKYNKQMIDEEELKNL